MQYYKGNAFQNEAEECQIIRERSSFFYRIGKALLYPFMLIFWMLEEMVHKSVEDDV
jgi:hypothetical protein